MLLYRIHLDPRCKEARRDLADPYQMHATLCRAFFPPETRCPSGGLLWRLEPETDPAGRPRVLIQSQATPDWSRIPYANWLAQADPGIDLVQKLKLDTLQTGQAFRFRLRANPSKTVHGKRQGLLQLNEQLDWLARKSGQHGFTLHEHAMADSYEFSQNPKSSVHHDVRVTHSQMLKGKRHDDVTIRVFSVLYEGRLSVMEPDRFRTALLTGIGHGKMMGLGLLSVIPIKAFQ